MSLSRETSRRAEKMLRDFFQIILIVALSLMFRSISGCPSPCMCKWKGGKQTVECGGHKLPNIPDGMDPGTQVLNFSHNSLTVLQSERFQKMELINLQKIFLPNNELIRINDRAFRGLSNLVELDLSDNMLTSIPTETFQDYSSLMRLSLSGNPIRDLKTSAFKYLSYLTTLELSNCQISVIEDEAFIGMDNLEWLKLDGNRIRTIRGSHILPESLNGISLHGNRWACDCRLMDIYGWLTTNAVPQIEDPKCFEPQKLQGHTIKSLQIDELACLPEISPTTIYLEIAEGRNISLLCKITAIPEASISWWFQGQILQNDTIIAPNLHLYYYIEEGLDEKRSELFIFNANSDDNGTFACIAENSAGRTQANYTIRVIVKEEPIVEEVSFPNEVFLFIIGGAIVICLLTVVCCCIIICKCRNQAQNSSSNRKKKKKRSKGKEVSFQLPNSQKCVAIANDINSSLVCSKINGNLTITDNNQQEMLLYLGNNTQNISINDMSLQGHCGPQDRNPDLINDAESLRQRNESDMKQQHQRDDNEKENNRNQIDNDNNFSLVPILRPIPARFTTMSTLPRGGSNNGVSRDMYQVDVHLNPGCFIDTNGYPVEYSLTQIPVINQAQVPVNYNYQTLPHNRAGKMGNNSVVRFSNEAEFITRTSQTFQTYSPDVRYTAEGYPCIDPVNGALIDAQNFPSPPEGYKTDNTSSLPTVALLNNQNFCPNSLAMQQQQQASSAPKWPSCLPGYHPQLIAIDTRFQMSPQPLQSPTSQQNPISVTKKCVGAQTSEMCDNNVIHEEEEEEDEDADGGGENHCNGSSSQTKCRQLKGPLADSPDEGYVGDGQESTDI
jgi:Leucine-rich repeat (LRR) protein